MTSTSDSGPGSAEDVRGKGAVEGLKDGEVGADAADSSWAAMDGSVAMGKDVGSDANISTPPLIRRFETMSASGPSAMRTWRSASRLVLPKKRLIFIERIHRLQP